MDHKERVLATLAHQRPDRVPFDVYEGWMWPEITARLAARLGTGDYEQLSQRLGASCRWVTPHYTGPRLPEGAKKRIASPHTTHSLNASIWGLAPGTREHHIGSAGHPLSHAQSAADLDNHSWPSPTWFDYEGLRREAREHAGYFVVAGGFSPLFYLMADLCGMEKVLLDVHENPELIDALVRRIAGFYREYFAHTAEAGQGCIDAIAFGDDFAGQNATLMSPVLWRRHFKGAWAELFAIAKERGYTVMFHSCGSVAAIIPDLVEIGLDVLYPVQPKATGMDPLALRERYGRTLAFYGGIDVQELLPFGSPEQIEAHVNRLATAFAGGGWILSTSHVLTDNVPEENALALYRCARAMG